MSADDAEFKKLYALLASLSSKTAPRANPAITPMISLMTEEPVMRTVVLDLEKPNEVPVLPRNEVPEEPTEEPSLEQIMSKSSKRSGTSFICEACMKPFSNPASLQLHQKQSEMCTYWFTLPNKDDYPQISTGIHIFMDVMLAEIVSNERTPTECRFCHTTFSNKGNLHKHFHKSTVCNRMAYLRFKSLVANLK